MYKTSPSRVSDCSVHAWTSRTPLLDAALEAINNGDKQTFIAKMTASHAAKECRFELDHPSCRANQIYAKAGGDRDADIHAFLVGLYAGEAANCGRDQVESLLAHPEFSKERECYTVPTISSRSNNASSSPHAGRSGSSAMTDTRVVMSSTPVYQSPATAGTGSQSVNHPSQSGKSLDYVLLDSALAFARKGDVENFKKEMRKLRDMAPVSQRFTFNLSAPGCIANGIYAKAGGDSNREIHEFLVGLYSLRDGNPNHKMTETILRHPQFSERRRAETNNM